MNLKTFLTAAAVASSILLVSCQKEAEKVQELDNPKMDNDKFSYAMGYDIGSSFLQTLAEDSVILNVDYLHRGITDGLKAKDSTSKTLMTSEEMAASMASLQEQMQARQQAKMAERQAKYEVRAKTAKEDGEKFLAENKGKAGVLTTKTGLQYKIISEGKGEIPKSNDKIKFQMVGKFIDGEEFQNTYTMDTPPEILLKELNIKCWSEAFGMMPIGSKWEIYSPAALAYGEQDTGVIPPNSAVVFVLELLDIVKEQP